MKKTKKLTALLSAMILAGASLSGCGSQETPGAEQPSAPVEEAVEAAGESGEDTGENDGTVELTICTVSKPFIKDMATNEFTLWLEEQTGIHINWIVVPQNNMQEKV